MPPIANAKAPPKWKTFDHSGSFIWHDHRMHYMSPDLPPVVKDQSRKTKVFDYEDPDQRRRQERRDRRHPLLGRPGQHLEDPVHRRRHRHRPRSAAAWSSGCGGGAATKTTARAHRWSRRRRPGRCAAPTLALTAALAAGALAVPAGALAHAQLEETTPERGAVVKHEPEAVIFRFDEPVEGNFGAVRVYDADGTRVDEGDAFHPNGEGPRLGVHLKPGLPDGSYTATYRVVSADGHIVSSGFVFSIGKAGKAPTETVAELTSGSGSGPVTETAFGIARGLQYVAIALAVGGLAFLLLAWLPALAAVGGASESWRRAARAFASRLRLVLLLAAAIGAISAAAGVVLEGAEAAGISGFSALK